MDQKTRDEGVMTASSWRGLAIGVAVVTLVSAAFTVPWILSANTDPLMLTRVQIVGAGMAVGLAIVTFCTVIWRGMISAAQAELQRLQIDKVSQQIVAAESSNLATLLHKGAELIADKEHPSRIAAGIASLRAVGEGSDDMFANQAMDILADYIERSGANVFKEPLGRSALDALRIVSDRTGRVATRPVRFLYDREYQEPDEEVRFELVEGARDVYYRGGYFEGLVLTDDVVGATRFHFTEVGIIEGMVDLSCAKFTSCFIRDALILRYDVRRVPGTEFMGCDFSGCIINNPQTFFDLRTGGNWFAKERPPISDLPDLDWSKFLHVGKPVPEPDPEDDDSIFLGPV